MNKASPQTLAILNMCFRIELQASETHGFVAFQRTGIRCPLTLRFDDPSMLTPRAWSV